MGDPLGACREVVPESDPTSEDPEMISATEPLQDAPEVSAKRLTPVTRLRNHARRLFRYTATSGISLGISEVCLLALYSSRTFGATTSALLATLAGTIPSYLLSRYWIWSEANRKRVGRQVVLYWATSFAAMAVTSVGTGLITHAAPGNHRAHVIFAGAAFLGLNVVLWVTKYVVYQKIIFRPHHQPAAETA
jgi:putative flippase GtrA